MIHSDIITALDYLVPEAQWTLSGDNYSDLVWLSEGNPPTLAEIEAEITLIPARKEEAKAQAKTKKAEILERLGITEEEARLLLS